MACDPHDGCGEGDPYPTLQMKRWALSADLRPALGPFSRRRPQLHCLPRGTGVMVIPQGCSDFYQDVPLALGIGGGPGSRAGGPAPQGPRPPHPGVGASLASATPRGCFRSQQTFQSPRHSPSKPMSGAARWPASVTRA